MRSRKEKYPKKQLVLGVTAALAMMASGTVLADDEKYSLNIKAQGASSALLELSRKSGSLIIVQPDVKKDVKLQKLQGDVTLQEALNILLKDSGLTYEFSSDGSVVVSNSDSGSAEDEEVDEEVVVTGSRLRNVSPTGNTIVITREEFKRQGLHTAEDIIRSLPQNFSSLNSGSTATALGSNLSPTTSAGQSSANLRGLGTSATLVLVNGRRVAGSPAFDGDGTVNLNTIPSSAIERVDILLEGASAIYGSDALAGVINFILRDDYQGGETTLRLEKDRYGGDKKSLSQVLGTSWDSGSVTAVLSYYETGATDQNRASRLGTMDWTSLGGGDYREQAFGFFGPNGGAPGNPGYVLGIGSLPAGAGSDWDPADVSLDNFVPFDRAMFPANGLAAVENTSVNLTFSQNLSEKVNLSGDIIYSENATFLSFGSLSTGSIFGGALVPEYNPFNNFDTPVEVAFLFEPGLIDNSRESTQERFAFNFGLNVELTDNWVLNVDGSLSKADNLQVATRALGGDAYNDALAGFDTEIDTDPTSPTFGQPVRVVDGSGNFIPVPALDLFLGNHQEGIDFQEFYQVTDSVTGSDATTKTELNEITAAINGDLFSIAGGEVGMSAGVTVREDVYDSSGNDLVLLLDNIPSPEFAEMTRDVWAAHFEFSFPLIGESNQVGIIEQLLVKAAGRYDEYTQEYYFEGFDQPQSERKFDNFSPQIGARMELAGGVTVRLNYSEAFRAPTVTEIGEPVSGNAFPQTFIDLSHPDFPGQAIPTLVTTASGGNPDLVAETTDTISFGVDWAPVFVEGLTLNVNYTETEWFDKIAFGNPRDARLASNSSLYPELFQRDPVTNNLTNLTFRSINLAESYLEVIDFNANYAFDTDVGLFDIDFSLAKTLEASDAPVPGEPLTVTSGTDLGPDEDVMKLQIGWSQGDYGVNLIAHKSSSYIFTREGRFEPGDPGRYIVEPYTHFDLTGYYDMDNGWKVKAGARNVTNNKYPFIDDRFRGPYDAKRFNPAGRLLYVDISKEFDF